MKISTLSLSPQKLLPLTVFLVEATDFEQQTLWQRHHAELSWKDGLWGVGQRVGELDGRPVMLSLKWQLLHGHPVLFFHDMSQVVDHQMVDAWLVANVPVYAADMPRKRCNPQNFHHCIRELEQLGVVSGEVEYAG